VRRWTLITLIVLLALLAVVAMYQVQLARQRDRLPDEPVATIPHPEATATAAP
jgi:hypothetical protein